MPPITGTTGAGLPSSRTTGLQWSEVGPRLASGSHIPRREVALDRSRRRAAGQRGRVGGRGLTDGKGARRELAVRGKGEMAIERCGGRVSEI